MAEKLVQQFTDTLYEKDSPVVVDRMYLFYNSDYGVNVLKITFRNVSVLTLYGLSVLIEPKDANGNETRDGVVEYNYYGIEVLGGRSFGSTEYVIMEQEAVDFDIRVIRAEYGENDVFRGNIRLKKMPRPEKLDHLGQFEDPFCDKIYERRPSLKPLYIPARRDYYWTCTCGRVYPLDIDQCRICSLEKEWILNLYPSLVAEKERQIAEEEERQRLEAERKRQEEERLEQERLAREEAERQLEMEKQAREEEARRMEEERLRILEEDRLHLLAMKKERKRKRINAILVTVSSLVIISISAYYARFFWLRFEKEKADLRNTIESQAEELDGSQSDSNEVQSELDKLKEKIDNMMKEKETEPTTEAVSYETEPEEKIGLIGNTGGRDLNVRFGPSTDYQVIGLLKPGDIVTILDKEGGWYQIRKDDLVGYVNGNYLMEIH